ncbi:MAG: hypothetical protein WDN23_01165 [Edaphobacter sp.]
MNQPETGKEEKERTTKREYIMTETCEHKGRGKPCCRQQGLEEDLDAMHVH